MTKRETNNTPTPGPQQRRRRPGEAPTKAGPADAEVTAQQALALLEPLLDFHRRVEGATVHDLRVSWDVRVVRGEDEPFAHVAGTSTLSRILAPNMRALAPSAIQTEVVEKISRPLTAAFQAEVERLTFDGLGGDGGEPPGGAAPDPPHPG